MRSGCGVLFIMKYLDKALSKLELYKVDEYEEVIELWITYGGD